MSVKQNGCFFLNTVYFIYVIQKLEDVTIKGLSIKCRWCVNYCNFKSVCGYGHSTLEH